MANVGADLTVTAATAATKKAVPAEADLAEAERREGTEDPRRASRTQVAWRTDPNSLHLIMYN